MEFYENNIMIYEKRELNSSTIMINLSLFPETINLLLAQIFQFQLNRLQISCLYCWENYFLFRVKMKLFPGWLLFG